MHLSCPSAAHRILKNPNHHSGECSSSPESASGMVSEYHKQDHWEHKQEHWEACNSAHSLTSPSLSSATHNQRLGRLPGLAHLDLLVQVLVLLPQTLDMMQSLAEVVSNKQTLQPGAWSSTSADPADHERMMLGGLSVS